MSLLRQMARTAIVAGTATHVSNNVSRRQAGRWARQEAEQQAAYSQPQQAAYGQPQQQYAEPEPVYAAPPAAAAPAAGGDDTIAKLTQLGDLKAAGVLTDEEFAAAKAKLLGL